MIRTKISKALVGALLLTVCACSHNESDDDGTTKTIKMDVANTTTVPLDTSRLIPLETSDSSIMYEIDYLEETNGKYFVVSRDIWKYFDAQTGKYLGDIAVRGRGPEEYLSIQNMWMEGDTLCIFDFDSNSIIGYDSNAKFAGKRSTADPDHMSSPNFLVKRPDGYYYTINSYKGGTGDPNPMFSLLGPDLKAVEDIPGREVKHGSYSSDRMIYDASHGRALAWDQARDTIFGVSEDGVVPAYIFDFGEYGMPAEFQAYDSQRQRIEAFSDEGKMPYAGLVKYCQVVDGNLYFIFYNPVPKKWCLGKYDMKNGKTSIFDLTSPDDRYQIQTWFKVYDDKVLLNFTDTQSPEDNPLIYSLDIKQLQD